METSIVLSNSTQQQVELNTTHSSGHASFTTSALANSSSETYPNAPVTPGYLTSTGIASSGVTYHSASMETETPQPFRLDHALHNATNTPEYDITSAQWNASYMDTTALDFLSSEATPCTIQKQWAYLGLVAVPVWILIGNSLVLMSVISYRNLRTLSNLVIASLAMTDFLLALIVVPLGIYQMVSERH